MALKLLEISIILLEVLGKLHEKDPYASGYDYDNIFNSDELKEYNDELNNAAQLLEEDGYVKRYLSNDNNIHAIGITEKGKLRLKQRLETVTKPTEIEIIIKDLISESNPDRPREMELHKTNDFYNKVNNLEDTEAKIDFLQQVLDGIEHYFIKKWTKNDRPGNYINGFPMVYWKKTIKEYSLYKKIKAMIERLIDDPKYHFPNYYRDILNIFKDSDKLKIKQASERKKYWEEHLFIDVLEIKEYLKTLQTNDEKIEFLDSKLHEMNQICYHYTDDNIEAILNEHGLTDKFTRIEYSPFSDYTHSHISKSEYRVFLDHLKDHIVPYMRNEKRRLDGDKPKQTESNDTIEAKINQNDITMGKDKQVTEISKSKIRWEGTETQLVYLFDELIKSGFLGQETNSEKYKLISEHFLNKSGKEFKPKQLSVTFQNLTGKKPIKSEIIDEIINKTKSK